jgi:hypothetical protein
MQEHAHAKSLSERADELEEEKMHEMERIITRSTFGYLMDGKLDIDTAPDMRAKHPGQYFLMRDDPRLRRCRRNRPWSTISAVALPPPHTCCRARRTR